MLKLARGNTRASQENTTYELPRFVPHKNNPRVEQITIYFTKVMKAWSISQIVIAPDKDWQQLGTYPPLYGLFLSILNSVFPVFV